MGKIIKSILVVSDTHINSKFAISHPGWDNKPPTKTYQDGELFTTRKELREKFKDAAVKHLKSIDMPAFTHVFHLGDIVDVNPRWNAKLELLSTREADVIQHAVDWFLNLPINRETYFRGVLGSFSHVLALDSDELEAKIFKEIEHMGYNAEIDSEVDVGIEWSGFSYFFYMTHALPKKYITNDELVYDKIMAKYIRLGQPVPNRILCGHQHSPKNRHDDWLEQGIEVVPALKFAGEKFGRYCDPLSNNGIMKSGFVTYDFEEGNSDPIRKAHPIHIVSNKKETKML